MSYKIVVDSCGELTVRAFRDRITGDRSRWLSYH